MEESSIARRVVRALDLQHNTPFPVFFSFPAASRLSRVEWFSRTFASRSLYYTWGKMGDYDVDKLAKICRHYRKERLKMSKIAEFESGY